MIVKIDNKEITLKYSFRGFMIYEQLTEKSFKPTGINEIITLFYSILMSSEKTFTKTFDEFIDWLDENPNMLNEFSEWLSKNINRDNELSPQVEDGEKEDRKGDSSKN